MSNDKNKKTTEPIDYLKNSPLYNMSLANMELFHSNFWAWLMRYDNSYIEVFFENFFKKNFADRTPKIEIYREKDHMDIVIQVKKGNEIVGKYIIENKLKSLPNMEQLAKYKNKCSDKFKSGIYTGVCDPKFPKSKKIEDKDGKEFDFCEKDWKFVSYKSVADKIIIKNDQERKEQKDFYTEVIDEYAKICKYLHTLLAKINSSDNGNNKFYLEEFEKYASIRLKDIAWKLKIEDFRNKLLPQFSFYEENGKESITYRGDNNTIYAPANYYFAFAETDFSNTTGSISFYIKSKTNSETKSYCIIGVQIQGAQYRRIFELGGKKAKNYIDYGKDRNMNAIKDNIEQNHKYLKDWFDLNFTSKMLFANSNNPQKTRMSQLFNGYSPHMIYQHWDISDEQNKCNSYEELIKQIFFDLKIAVNIINKKEGEPPN